MSPWNAKKTKRHRKGGGAMSKAELVAPIFPRGLLTARIASATRQSFASGRAREGPPHGKGCGVPERMRSGRTPAKWQQVVECDRSGDALFPHGDCSRLDLYRSANPSRATRGCAKDRHAKRRRGVQPDIHWISGCSSGVTRQRRISLH